MVVPLFSCASQGRQERLFRFGSRWAGKQKEVKRALDMQQVNESDSCLEEALEEKEERVAATVRHDRCDAFLTRCLEVGMILVYGTAFLGLLF